MNAVNVSTRPPIPPEAMRAVVGPFEPEAFDNPAGAPIYNVYDVPLAA